MVCGMPIAGQFWCYILDYASGALSHRLSFSPVMANSPVKQTRKALVLGASGQDGAYLAQALLQAGHLVVGAFRSEAPPENFVRLGIADRVQSIRLDVSRAQAVHEAIATLRPTHVYNLAGQTSVAESFREPAETFDGIALGTIHVLEAVRQLNPEIRLFNAGSGEMFGDTGGVAANEATPLAPCNPYAIAKSAAFWSVANHREAHGLFACTGILFNHESPLRSQRFVTRKIAAAAARIARGSDERLTLGNLEVSRDWGWAPEYVEAMRLMLEEDAPRDFVLASGATVNLQEFVDAAFAAVGLRWREHVDFDSALKRPTDVSAAHADPTLAAGQLGWRASTRGLDVARRLVEAELAERSQ